MKKCPNCHTQFSEEKLFCEKCGSRLTSEEPKESVIQYIYCSSCGTQCVSTDKFCKSCGHTFVKPEESVKRNGSSKKIVLVLLILIISIVLLGIFAIMGNSALSEKRTEKETEEKEDIHSEENGIEVDGTWYTFSAENGIDNYQDINDGYITYRGLSLVYWPIGATESQSTDGMEYSSVVQSTGGWKTGNGEYIIGSEFRFFENYKTADGISRLTSENQMQKKGYLCLNDYYTQFFTEDGKVDWAEIEEDFDRCKEDGSWEDLYYYDALIQRDIIVSSLLQTAEKDELAEDKNRLLLMMAQAKLGEDLVQGKFDYFYVQTACAGGPMLISIYADEEKVRSWHDKWIAE